MIVNVEAVLIVSGMIFTTCMGGLVAAWIMMRRIDRDVREDLERFRR